MKPPSATHAAGFTFPEVMTASLLLSLAVVNSTNIFMQSQKSVYSSGMRDATYALISKDIEKLRGKSWRFGCEGLELNGTPSDSAAAPDPNAGSCTGLERHAGNPVAYKTGRRIPLTPYSTACTSTETPLSKLLVDNWGLSNQLVDYPLPWSGAINQSNLQAGTQSIQVLRNIEYSGNELRVSYATSSTSPVKINVNTTLILQAAAFCP